MITWGPELLVVAAIGTYLNLPVKFLRHLFNSKQLDLTKSYDKRIDHDSSVSLAINGLSLQTEEV